MTIMVHRLVTSVRGAVYTLSDKDIARFWYHVDVRDPDECWPWKKSLTVHGGYGQFRIKETVLRAHRVALELTVGPIGTQWALHHCDTPDCNNPRDLYPGTLTDNVGDMRRRGRGYDIPPRYGDQIPWAKITDKQAGDILDAADNGVRQSDLAHLYGISRSAINRLVKGKTRRWLHSQRASVPLTKDPSP